MLTTEEKRFIKYWEEQRTGGKYKYYLLYIIVGTFVASIVLNFLLSMFSYAVDLELSATAIFIISFLVVTYITTTTWRKNEKKFKGIIKREIHEGRMKDNKYTDEKLV